MLVLLIIVMLHSSATPSELQKALTPAPTLVPIPKLPVIRQAVENIASPELTAQAAIVMEANSGEVIFELNSNLPLAPASATKLLTALTARELYQPISVASISAGAITDTRPVIKIGQTYTVSELLAALLINSSNTAAFSLAQNDLDGFSGFVAKMNQQAKELGLKNTSASNPAGFDDSSQRSTAYELAILLRATLMDPLLRSLLTKSSHQLMTADQTLAGTIFNTHQLLGIDSRIVGGKTGTTDEAGQVLVSMAVIDNQPLVIVVMGSEDRYTDTQKLLDWTEVKYNWYTPEIRQTLPEIFLPSTML